jgi:ankyrin repeat protein
MEQGLLVAIAAAMDNVPLLELLHQYGARLSASGDRALIEAASRGKRLSIAYLLDHGANVHALRDEPIVAAAQHGHDEAVALLIDRGATAKAQNNRALRDASANGHYRTTMLLIDRGGANVNARNGEPLMNACRKGHTHAALLLLDRGADPRMNEYAALRQAIEQGHDDLAVNLFAMGYLRAQVDGDVAVELAHELQNYGLVKQLEELGIKRKPIVHGSGRDRGGRRTSPPVVDLSNIKSHVVRKLFDDDLHGGFRLRY